MQTYNWTGSGITWNNTTADLTGVALYDSNNKVLILNKSVTSLHFLFIINEIKRLINSCYSL